jgi:hypothetical protein
MTSVAGAAFQIAINGDKDLSQWDNIAILPSDTIILSIWTDTYITQDIGTGYLFLVVNTSLATIDYTTGASVIADDGVLLEHSMSAAEICEGTGLIPAGEDGIFGIVWPLDTSQISIGATIFDMILFHCEAFGDAVIKLYYSPDGEAMALVDYVVIHQSDSKPVKPPVADAGNNQVVYACLNGIAGVKLDGSGSYDPDGNKLTYLWTWSIDGTNYETNGVSHAIELSIGRHQIELTVNDGNEDSAPDEVMIDVIGPMEGQLSVIPHVINPHFERQNIIATLKLPVGITQDQIDSNLVLYPGKIEASYQIIGRYDERNMERVFILARFKASDLIETVGSAGPVQLDVVGQLKTGQYFFGSDTVRIPNPPWRPIGH